MLNLAQIKNQACGRILNKKEGKWQIDSLFAKNESDIVLKNKSEKIFCIGAATARVARVLTLPTFGNLTWDPPKIV